MAKAEEGGGVLAAPKSSYVRLEALERKQKNEMGAKVYPSTPSLNIKELGYI